MPSNSQIAVGSIVLAWIGAVAWLYLRDKRQPAPAPVQSGSEDPTLAADVLVYVGLLIAKLAVWLGAAWGAISLLRLMWRNPLF